MVSRKLTKFAVAGAAAAAVAVGGVAIAGSSGSSSSAASGTATTATAPASRAAGAATATAKVIPFQRGAPSQAKVVGQVPASYKAGTGTIVTGAAAEKAKAAALAAYPGGTVNRVVLLSDGQYNVHIIAVNWPHHVFVNQEFKVIGAE